MLIISVARVVKLKPKQKYIVIYDGSCHFCLSCISLLQRLDLLRKLTYADFRKPSFAKKNREKLESLESELWLVSPDKMVYRGFFAFRKMAVLLPLLWILVPFAYLPFAGVVGGWAYALVSEKRLYISRLFHFGCKSCKNK